MAQSKAWTFTIFEYDDEGTFVEQLQEKVSECSLLCFQEERSPTTGNTHLQGFVRFPTNRRFNAIKVWLNSTSAHIEVAKGSSQANLTYCTKDDTSTGRFRFQHGDFASFSGVQGKRSDLDLVEDLIRSNASLEDLTDGCMQQVIKYSKGIQFARAIFANKTAPKAFPRVVIVCHGRAGSGKSQWAREYALFRNLRVYSKNLTKSSDVQWFDGYDGEELLLLDDFTPAAVGFRELLQWLDIYKHSVQTKGSMVNAAWRHVIITSNSHPDSWYVDSHPGSERQPLTRRIDHPLHAPSNINWWFKQLHNPEDPYPGRDPPAHLCAAPPSSVIIDGHDSVGESKQQSRRVRPRENKYDDDDDEQIVIPRIEDSVFEDSSSLPSLPSSVNLD